MVTILRAAIAASLGMMVYLAIPILFTNAPVYMRRRVGSFYLKLSARALKQFAFVRRVLSGYDVMPIDVDDEQKLLNVTLSSSTLGSDSVFEFNDPDNRISRLYSKPAVVAYENIPAVVDAELAEIGHWVGEKENEDGLWSGDPQDPESVTVDPYVEMDTGLHLVDPIDAFELVGNGVDPENIKTTEKLTKKRFEKYKTNIGATEVISTVVGFFAGLGGMMLMEYVNTTLLDGEGGSGVDIPMNPGLVDTTHLVDLVVMLL